MKRSQLLTVALLITFGAGSILAQPRVESRFQNPQSGAPEVPRDYGSLIDELFAPITDKLDLTKEQQFQIIAIITETDVKSDPLIRELANADEQLTAVGFGDLLDEVRIRDLLSQEGMIMTKLIEMKFRAKTTIYQLLTPVQRTLVAQQFRVRGQVEGSLGGISIY